MAHERITSEDVEADVIVQWNDEGGVVSVGMMWDEPSSDSDAEQADGEIVERRVEGDVGGMIAVPTEPYVLRPYLDNEGRWSIYMHFDRARVNGLIRTLRRARNKAFGADE